MNDDGAACTRSGTACHRLGTKRPPFSAGVGDTKHRAGTEPRPCASVPPGTLGRRRVAAPASIPRHKRGHAHAAPDAEGREPYLEVAAGHLVDEGNQDP